MEISNKDIFAIVIFSINVFLFFFPAMNLVNKLKIDDPVGSFAVHYAAGIWGMIATGFFAEGDTGHNSGVFRHGNGDVLAYNIVAMIVISLWNGGWTAIIVSSNRNLLLSRIFLENECFVDYKKLKSGRVHF